MMDLHAGRPFWPIRDGLPGTFPPLHEDTSCDVLVVGAGVTGALVAHELSARGHDVIVLDARDAAMGSTAASTALVVHEVDPEHIGLERWLGRAGADETYLRMAAAVQELAALSRRLGAGAFAARPSLYLASQTRHVKRLRHEYEARRRLGFPVEWLSAQQLRHEYGCTRAAAIRTEGQGHLDPYSFTYGLLSNGLRVHDRTKVRSVQYRRTGVIATTDRQATVRAAKVVFATGYETDLHKSSFPKKLYTTYALASEPGVELWDDHAMFWETNRPYLYGRCSDDGRLLLGGFNDPYLPRLAAERAGRRAASIARQVRRVFPGLEFEVAFGWGGTFADTADGLPYAGPDPQHPNAYFVLGYGANGTVFAQVGAKAIADLIEGKPGPFKSLRTSWG